MNNLERKLEFLKKELADHDKEWQESQKDNMLKFASMLGHLRGLVGIAIKVIEEELGK